MFVDIIIKNANEVLTLKGHSLKPKVGPELRELGIIKKGAIAINNGKIVGIGKTDVILKKHDSAEVIDAESKIVLPGFIDPHTHLVYAGSREDELTMKLEGVPYLEILKRGGGILKTVRLTRNASEKELFEQAKKRLDRALINGTTTMEAKSGYGLTVRDEMKILRVNKMLDNTHPIEIISTFMGAHAIPQEFKYDPDAYVDLIINKMIPSVAKQNLAVFNDVFVEKGVFSTKQGYEILNAGRKYGLTPKVHADEFNDLGGAKLAAEVSAISADHLLNSSEEGLKMMAEKKIIGVLLPATSMVLMNMKFANVRKIIDLGVPVALATDLNPNCWVENMQFIITLAIYFLKLTPAETISAATINAAHAIGKAKEIGSIEKGKRANIIIMDIPHHMFIGYMFGCNLVKDVIVNGKIVVRDGKLVMGG